MTGSKKKKQKKQGRGKEGGEKGGREKKERKEITCNFLFLFYLVSNDRKPCQELMQL
jgi:hypothetical protein